MRLRGFDTLGFNRVLIIFKYLSQMDKDSLQIALSGTERETSPVEET